MLSPDFSCTVHGAGAQAASGNARSSPTDGDDERGSHGSRKYQRDADERSKSSHSGLQCCPYTAVLRTAYQAPVHECQSSSDTGVEQRPAASGD